MLEFLAIPLVVLLLSLLASPVCLADDGQGDDSEDKNADIKYHSIDDYIQKIIRDHYPNLLLQFIGNAPAVAENAVPLVTELTAPIIEKKFLDCVFRLFNNMIDIIEFQSSLRKGIFFRCFKYASYVAANNWNHEEDLLPTIRTTLILRGDILKPPQSSDDLLDHPFSYYPSEMSNCKGILNFSIRLLYLCDCDGIDKIVEKYWPEFERFKKDGGKFPLSKDEIFQFLIAPLVLSPNVSSTDIEKFLEMGRVISKEFDDLVIFNVMFIGVVAKNPIFSREYIKVF
ncbi:MAG: hypothetical protein LBT40_02220 [Deltaproteobacteria bacterium]|jgi:hypothetical protein|nr:hypothetical protein [Deltaproteobacteria bacterium]